MGDLYTAPVPRCPVHGRMHYQMAMGSMGRWECNGFDGERCDYTVTDVEVAWQHIGQTDDSTFELPAGTADPDTLLRLRTSPASAVTMYGRGQVHLDMMDKLIDDNDGLMRRLADG